MTARLKGPKVAEKINKHGMRKGIQQMNDEFSKKKNTCGWTQPNEGEGSKLLGERKQKT